MKSLRRLLRLSQDMRDAEEARRCRRAPEQEGTGRVE
jgi:hypothetical protein